MATATPIPHPYYPQDLYLPSYKPPILSTPVLLAALTIPSSALILFGYYVTGRFNPKLSSREKLGAIWFLFCGVLHVQFEGYWIRQGMMGRKNGTGESGVVGGNGIRDMMWKEYAKSDSRYLTRDGGMWAGEVVTVLFMGPLCLLTYYATAFDYPWRHPIRLFTCALHILSVTLYFITAGNDSRPEPVYYWGYFWGMNLPWFVIPAILAWRSGKWLTEKMVEAQEAERRRKIR